MARKKASRYRPDRRVTAVREASDGQEKTWRCTHRRARLGRVLRRPHGLDDELLCHARRLFQPGSAKTENCRGVEAEALGVQSDAGRTRISESDVRPSG